MSTFFSYLKKNYAFLLASFFLPLLILAVIYLGIGIYPGSSRSVLASDAFSQFSNFHASFRNVLVGKQSIFYTWNASLGLNYLSLASYYLGGLFTPLVLFFPNQAMPDALYFITLIKIGAAGLSFYLYASHTFQLSRWNHLTLTVCYALMSFAIAHSEIIMWLDTFTFFPLIIWGINRILEKKNGSLLFISYTALFISNFYMGFMIGLFSGLYYLVQLFSQWKRNKASFIPYFVTSLLAVGASLIVILPTILDLRTNGEALTKITTLKTEATGPFDFFIKNMIGVYDTTKYGSIPFIYIGLLPLSLCFVYFLSKSISWKPKVGYFLIATLLIASFYLQPLNLFWQGMHAPNMFLFRFSFLLSFLVIMLAGYGWELLTKEQLSIHLFSILLLIGLFTTTYGALDQKKYDYLDLLPFVVTIIFLLIYFITIGSQKLALFTKKNAAILLLVCVIMEMGLNTNGLIRGILKDWNYSSSSLFEKPYPSIKKLVNQTKKNSSTFYRMENLDAVSSNDSINYGYSGVSMFSSIRNRHSSSYLDALGFRSRGTNLNIRYNNNTLIGDAVTGMKYNIATQAFNKFGYSEIGSQDSYTLYENKNALPLAFLTPSEDKTVTRISNDNLQNQTTLMNYLSGLHESYFSFIPIQTIRFENTTVETNGNETSFKEITANVGKQITWEATIPAHTQAYFSLFPTNYGDLGSSSVTISTDGGERKSQVNITGQYYDLGYYENETQITFTADFFGSKKVSFQSPKIVALNTNAYQKAIDQAKRKSVPMVTSKRGATATIESSKNQTLVASIPYDRGWKAKIDGKTVPIEAFKDGFIKIAIPKGKHQLKLSYLPLGFIPGLLSFILCTTLFVIFTIIYPKQKKAVS